MSLVVSFLSSLCFYLFVLGLFMSLLFWYHLEHNIFFPFVVVFVLIYRLIRTFEFPPFSFRHSNDSVYNRPLNCFIVPIVWVVWKCTPMY